MCVRHQTFWLPVEVTCFLPPSPYCIMHSSNELSEKSSPSAGVAEHGWSATINEDLLENIIPCLTMQQPAHTLCDVIPGRTPKFTCGDHMHIWCHKCANLPDWHHRAAMFETCQDCRILRTILQLSQRWRAYIWDEFYNWRELTRP